MIYTKEKKYIIAFKYGRIKHFIFPYCQHHAFFARDNGLDIWNKSEVIETGILQEGKAIILTCSNEEHKKKRDYIQLNHRQLKAREAQSLYCYRHKRNEAEPLPYEL